ncbi:MAG: sigma factor G inhibitor Gin [Bacillaceae bacterium]|nr:sigma factor G inhibitor Gin [Bacillaceae bacterium]
MSKPSAVKRMCQICQEEKDEGIIVYHAFICSDCEQEIVKTEPEDEKYNYFVKKLKIINQTTQYS